MHKHSYAPTHTHAHNEYLICNRMQKKRQQIYGIAEE